MNGHISVEEKKVFIRWFLNTQVMKRRESVWILNYLMGHEVLLKNVHFVDGISEISECPRALSISAQNSIYKPFQYYKGDMATHDAERAFHDIKDNPEEPLYIQVNYPGKELCPEYAAVETINPYYKDIAILEPEEKEGVELMLSSLLDANQENLLRQRIDAALDAGDKLGFMKLTEDLQVITGTVAL